MRMVETGVSGVEFLAVNTDQQALSRFGKDVKTLNIGKEGTQISALAIIKGFHLIQYDL